MKKRTPKRGSGKKVVPDKATTLDVTADKKYPDDLWHIPPRNCNIAVSFKGNHDTDALKSHLSAFLSQSHKPGAQGKALNNNLMNRIHTFLMWCIGENDEKRA